MWSQDPTKKHSTIQKAVALRSEELCICWHFSSGNSWCIVPKTQAYKNTMKNVWNPRKHLLKQFELVSGFSLSMSLTVAFSNISIKCSIKPVILKAKEGGHVYMHRDMRWQSEYCRPHLPSIIMGVA